MELIYTDAAWRDVGVLHHLALDMAFGIDENDFELKLDARGGLKLDPGSLIYVEGTEYGGRITKPGISTSVSELTYRGRTWHGILEDQRVCPAKGQDYYKLSGEANACLAQLIADLGIGGLFQASDVNSGINIATYQFARYTDAYSGILAMLLTSAAKLKLAFDGATRKVIMWAEPIVDYSGDKGVETDTLDIEMEHDTLPYNHLICLGKGELKDRLRIDFYADANRNVGTTQKIFGIDHRATIYDFSNAEEDELRSAGLKRLEELQNADSVSLSLPQALRTYDINDLIGSTDIITGTTAATNVVKKIVSIDRKGHSLVSYEVGDGAKVSSDGIVGRSESSAYLSYTAGPGITINGLTISADVTDSDLEGVTKKADDAYAIASNLSADVAAAQGDATQALSDAAGAQRSADAAQSTANTAVSNAAAAQSDATQALSDAAAAQSSADSAQADATQALSDAAAAQATANAKADLVNGVVPASELPKATTSTVGAVKPDGVTVTVASDGTISAQAGQAASFLAAHPVGSYFLTSNSTNPGSLYGGTWVLDPSFGPYCWRRTA